MYFKKKKIFWKTTATTLPPNILYMFFTTRKLQPQILPNTHLNPTNYIFLKLIFLKSLP